MRYDVCKLGLSTQKREHSGRWPSRTDGSDRCRRSRPVSVSNDVYDAIYEHLMSLEIAPGARIPIDILARDLSVSQTPVREALSRLEREGLVGKLHLVGYSAAPQLTRKQFDDLYEFRLLLEPEGARHAAPQHDAGGARRASRPPPRDMERRRRPGRPHQPLLALRPRRRPLPRRDHGIAGNERDPRDARQPARAPAHLPPDVPRPRHRGGAGGARGDPRRVPRRRSPTPPPRRCASISSARATACCRPSNDRRSTPAPSPQTPRPHGTAACRPQDRRRRRCCAPTASARPTGRSPCSPT